MTAEPLWLSVSALLLGVEEIPGPTSEQLILRWAKDIGVPAGSFTNDDTAWCAVFLNRLMLACQLPMSAERGSWDLLRAKSFASWGIEVREPSLGTVLVFGREGGGHVGLYLGERSDAYLVRGGNTGNQVADTWLLKSRLITARWPASVLQVGGRVLLTHDGHSVSVDES